MTSKKTRINQLRYRQQALWKAYLALKQLIPTMNPETAAEVLKEMEAVQPWEWPQELLTRPME